MIQSPRETLEDLQRLEREFVYRIGKETKTMKICRMTEELKLIREQIKELKPKQEDEI